MKALNLNMETRLPCKQNAHIRNRFFLIFCILFLSVLPVQAADNKEDFKPKIIHTVLSTKDGWLIPITYYQSKLRENSPVLIFLHGKNGNRLNWDDEIAPIFNDEGNGYTVITVDLRKHGKSKAVGKDSENRTGKKIKSVDYKLMVAEDLEAVKKFIYFENQQKNLNMRKIAIIATDMSTPVAMVFAYRDWMKLPYQDGPTLETSTPKGQDIRALVLISPEESLPGLNASKIIKDLKDPAKNMAILTVVGLKDKRDEGQAGKIYRKLDGKKNDPKSGRFQMHEYKTKYRGYNLINNNTVLEKVYDFLEKEFKPINDPWRDRESQYNK